MDEDIKRLIKKLSLAMSNALSNSEEIKEIVQQIKKKGYNIFLFLEANIGLNKREPKDYSLKESSRKEVPGEDILEDKMSPKDREFLRSIKIKID